LRAFGFGVLSIRTGMGVDPSYGPESSEES
jgi:hypothetical protein